MDYHLYQEFHFDRVYYFDSFYVNGFSIFRLISDSCNDIPFFYFF